MIHVDFDTDVKFERFGTRNKGGYNPYAKHDGKRGKNKVVRGKAGRDYETEDNKK